MRSVESAEAIVRAALVSLVAILEHPYVRPCARRACGPFACLAVEESQVHRRELSLDSQEVLLIPLLSPILIRVVARAVLVPAFIPDWTSYVGRIFASSSSLSFLSWATPS